MSIFGDTTPEISENGSPVPSFIEEDQIDHSIDEGGAQPRQDFDTFIEDELEDHTKSGGQLDAAYEDNEDDQYSRPNRFTGSAAQWRVFTAEERESAASLDQVRHGDLSSHLYNAYALQRHVTDEHERLSIDGERGRKHRREFPGDNWTAWPLKPELVPRAFETFGVAPSDLHGPQSYRDKRTSKALSQEIQALLQKHAKERWARTGGAINPDTETAAFHKSEQELVVLADDDKARDILHPVVSSVLAKFDLLLLALHQSRKVFSGADQDQEIPAQEPAPDNQWQTNKAPSRSRSRSKSSSRPKGVGRGVGGGRPKRYDKRDYESYYQMHRRLTEESLGSTPRDHLSRDSKTRRPASENHYTMYKRLGQGDEVAVVSDGQVPAETRPANVPSAIARSKPRDWSEVMGIAAQQGFGEAVVRRAADRCSALFGEKMNLVTLGRPSDADSSMACAGIVDPETSLKCPVKTCEWHKRRFVDVRACRRHVLQSHEEDVSYCDPALVMMDGVHLDGFLQVIEPVDNWSRHHTDTEESER